MTLVPRGGQQAPVGRVVEPAELGAAERDEMFVLLDRHVLHARRERFERELDASQWVLLLTAPGSGRVEGFATVRRIATDMDHLPVVALVSGSTIVAPARRGSVALPRLWARVMFSLAAGDRLEGARAFWLLAASGVRTYRLLPVFFRHYIPCCFVETPPWAARLRDRLGELAFGEAYEPGRGIVRFPEPTPLRPGVADLAPARRRDPHVAYFCSENPGHLTGDELVCLAEISEPNLTAAGRRMLGLPGELR
ncbi:MAG TPA: hypothetical protein P5234_09990 [Thermoanaerobaculaceae bacterium]|nr:hypothetical protein [Thermoanaerobaculaceae bacterium]HRS16561.1 hypothetical protein [Thermoanaerobaculaceae bacterium]